MRLQMFAVRDGAVGAFLPPFGMRSKGEAIRAFTEAVGNPEHQFAKHASDFVLFFIGEFDDNAGMFAPCEPLRLLSGLECSGPDVARARPGNGPVVEATALNGSGSS